MITCIEQIEIDNIRAIGQATIQPLTDGGHTALTGPSGVGKSTVVDTVLFVLFGVTPDQVPVSAMRRQGSTGTCRGVVTFLDDGQRVRIERGLRGAKDTPYATIHVDGVEQVAGKIKAANAWIVDRLGGLDSKGWLAAFVIRQKELDELVTATPAVRRARIEKLAGIDRMSAALKAAREEANDISRRLDLLPGSREEVLAARAALDTTQDAAIAAWDALEAARSAETTAVEAAATAAADLAAIDRALTAATAADAAATTTAHALTLATERATAARAAADALVAAAEGGDPETLAAAQAAHTAATEAAHANRDATAAAQRAAQAATAAEARAATAAERATTAAQRATAARAAASAAATTAASYPDDLPAAIAAAETAERAAAEAAGALRGEYERLAASIKALGSATDPTCPTCATALPDPTAVLAALTAAQARVVTDGQAAAAAATAAATAATETRVQAAEAARAQATALAAAQASDAAAAAANEAAQADDVARAEAVAATQAAVTAQAAAAAAADQQHIITQALADTAHAVRLAQNAADAARDLPAARQAAEAAAATAAQARQAHAQALASQAASACDPDEVAAVRARHAQAAAAATAATLATQAAAGEHRLTEAAVGNAERTRDAEEAKMRVRAETYAQWEIKTAVRDALDAFRKDRIARIAPEVSEVATDLIPGLTEGRYVSVELDEDFTPVVTDERGVSRPAPWLSGGEKDAVALAMRVAFSDLISGAAGGPFIADEPFTGQDAARRVAMANTIRGLPNRQTIIISHAPEATDMVDLVLAVIPDDVHGSRVVPAGAGFDPLDTSALDVDTPVPALAWPGAPRTGERSDHRATGR